MSALMIYIILYVCISSLIFIDTMVFIFFKIDSFNLSERIHFSNKNILLYLTNVFVFNLACKEYISCLSNGGISEKMDTFLDSSLIPFILAGGSILFIIIYSIYKYMYSLNYGKRCSLKLFLKTYKILKYSSDDINLKYDTQDINFSFVSHFIVGELIYQKYFRNKKSNKKKEIQESQKELYSMMIKDLQKIQKEEEAKAAEYFSTAEKTAKDIQKTLDIRHSL